MNGGTDKSFIIFRILVKVSIFHYYFFRESPEESLKIVAYAPYSALRLYKSRTQFIIFTVVYQPSFLDNFNHRKVNLWLWNIDICLNTSILES